MDVARGGRFGTGGFDKTRAELTFQLILAPWRPASMSALRFLQTVGILGGVRSRGRKRRGRASGSGSGRIGGRYILQEAIGAGAVGEVWHAEDPLIGRSVAIKLLNVPAGAAGKQKAEWEARFVREARAAGALS